MIIRHVKKKDLTQLIAIEKECFMEDEAASMDAFDQRVSVISDSFFVADENNTILGYINGPVISDLFITDDLFEEINKNPAIGGYQSVLGLAVSKKYQSQQVATKLLEAIYQDAITKKRKAITLTCKEELISFYEKNGYKNFGLSTSTHGGQQWYNLVNELPSKNYRV